MWSWISDAEVGYREIYAMSSKLEAEMRNYLVNTYKFREFQIEMYEKSIAL